MISAERVKDWVAAHWSLLCVISSLSAPIVLLSFNARFVTGGLLILTPLGGQAFILLMLILSMWMFIIASRPPWRLSQ